MSLELCVILCGVAIILGRVIIILNCLRRDQHPLRFLAFGGSYIALAVAATISALNLMQRGCISLPEVLYILASVGLILSRKRGGTALDASG